MSLDPGPLRSEACLPFRPANLWRAPLGHRASSGACRPVAAGAVRGRPGLQGVPLPLLLGRCPGRRPADHRPPPDAAAVAGLG